MSTLSVAVQLPQALYQRLERLAELTHRPVESLVVQAVTASLPPLPDDLPEPARADLIALEALDDADLWRVVREMAPPERQERLAELVERQRQEIATAAEATEATRLRSDADRVMLRKAYAAVLLKWRGQRLPSLAELANSA